MNNYKYKIITNPTKDFTENVYLFENFPSCFYLLVNFFEYYFVNHKMLECKISVQPVEHNDLARESQGQRSCEVYSLTTMLCVHLEREKRKVTFKV